MVPSKLTSWVLVRIFFVVCHHRPLAYSVRHHACQFFWSRHRCFAAACRSWFGWRDPGHLLGRVWYKFIPVPLQFRVALFEPWLTWLRKKQAPFHGRAPCRRRESMQRGRDAAGESTVRTTSNSRKTKVKEKIHEVACRNQHVERWWGKLKQPAKIKDSWWQISDFLIVRANHTTGHLSRKR